MRHVTSIPIRTDVRVCLQREDKVDVCHCLSLEAQGAVFQFHWRMELMSNLRIGIEWCGVCKKMVEGIVIGCVQTGIRSFETTVIFVEPASANGTHGDAGIHLLN